MYPISYAVSDISCAIRMSYIRYIIYRISRHTTIPYHTIPYHTIPYHTIPYHTIPYHTLSHDIILHRLISCHTYIRTDTHTPRDTYVPCRPVGLSSDTSERSEAQRPEGAEVRATHECYYRLRRGARAGGARGRGATRADHAGPREGSVPRGTLSQKGPRCHLGRRRGGAGGRGQRAARRARGGGAGGAKHGW